MRTLKIFTIILGCFFMAIGIQAQTAAKNKALVVNAYEKYNESHDVKEWIDLLADDYTDYSMGPEPVKGKAAVLEASNQFVAAFPDLNWKIFRSVAEGNMVWVELQMSGTFKNDFMGMKATNKSFSFKDVQIYEFDKKGKIKAGWGIQDPMVMMSQIMEVK
jgi:steroid delta-isomerase-like uncharacterized protein